MFTPRFRDLRRAWCDGPHGGYVAFDSVRNEDVVIHYPYLTKHADRFNLEADAYEALAHPCVAPILHRDVDSRGLPFYTQPNVDWRPLDITLRRPESLPLRAHIRILIDVSDAVRCVHDAGFLHLNLALRSIYLTNTGHVQVMGRSWQTPPVFIAAGWFIDQPNMYYGAPEQHAIFFSPSASASPTYDSSVDARADVYALGGILHTFLHGAAPGGYYRIQDHLVLDPPLIHQAQREPALTEQLTPLWRAALERDPEHRPPTVAAFTRALRRALWTA